MKKFLHRHWHRIVLGVFLLIHALICAFTNLYGDDYYYANFVRQGADYFIGENIYHYRYTNGRALVHLLDELLIGWSFWLWRIFNVVLVALLVIVLAKLASRAYREDIRERYGEYQLAVAVSCGLLSVTDVAILRQSVYWATGAMNYLLPATAVLWFYYMFRRDFEHLRGSWWLLIPAFFVSATTEQASAAALLVTLCFIISSIAVKRKPPRPAYIGAFAVSLAGLCTLYLSPGNRVRTGFYPDFYAKSLPEKIQHNVYGLASLIFGREGMAVFICIIFLMIIAVCLIRYARSTRPAQRFADLLLCGETSLALGLYIWGLTSSPETLEAPWMGVLIALPLSVVMICTVVDYFKRGEIDNLFFVWCAVAMQGAMLFSPVFGQRTLTISLVCLCIPMVRVLIKLHRAELYAAIALVLFLLLPPYMAAPSAFALILAIIAAVLITLYAKFGKSANITPFIACFALAVCLAQFSTVAIGYYGNVAVNELNRRQIEEYKESDRSAGLVLYYLPNAAYKYTMPYDDPYHRQMLLILCGLDPDTQVWYEFLDQ